MTPAGPRVVVLGASGLIGSSVVAHLRGERLTAVAVARRFTRPQASFFGPEAVVTPLAALSPGELGVLLRGAEADIVVNCLGVLQDGPRGGTKDIHEAFVARLVEAVRAQPRPVLLVHVSVPGDDGGDATAFARTKRSGERLVADSRLPFAVLRPGFVVAPAAYGGSALLRALAATPFGLPDTVASRPFASVGVEEIGRTVALLARRWAVGERRWDVVWDLCERQPSTVGSVLDAIRAWGGGPVPRVTLPGPLLRLGARVGDAVAWLGWSPPVRTTALREMLRGVEGRPEAWIAATGIEPRTLVETLRRLPATVQERWFARLYLLKPLVIGGLALFWIVSGSVALTAAFEPAAAILTSHGISAGLANGLTVLTSLADIAVGTAIALRRTCRAGLLAGIALSLAYMAGAAILAPALWLDPLGALVKTGPAIILMMVGLAILDDR